MLPLRARTAVAGIVLASCAACGQNRDPAPPPPLGPELYEIAAGDVPPPGKYLRYAPPGPKGGGLDIAVTDLAPETTGPRISLVGVVHVADALYYEAVQRELDGYDVVLYEGVKAKGLSGREWQQRALTKSGEAGEMQREIALWFGFRYQLEAIDYGRKNLVHADMDLDRFAEEGGAALGLVPRPGDSDASSAAMPEAVKATWTTVKGFGRLVLGEPGPIQSLARRMFAETMGTTDIGTTLDLLPGLSDLVLSKRNAVVMTALHEQVAKTRGSVAVFYGAAHMADLEKRIAKELDYHRVGGHWLRAWALRPPLR